MTKTVSMALGAALLVLAGTGIASANPAILATEAALSDGPGDDYAEGQRLPAGTHVDVLDCAQRDGIWCLIDRRGKRGWVSLQVLDLYPGKKGVNLPGDVADGGDGKGKAADTPQLQSGVLAELNDGGVRLERTDPITVEKGNRPASFSANISNQHALAPAKAAKP